jgi:hypothetical protein
LPPYHLRLSGSRPFSLITESVPVACYRLCSSRKLSGALQISEKAFPLPATARASALPRTRRNRVKLPQPI